MFKRKVQNPVTMFLVFLITGIHIFLYLWAYAHPEFSLNAFYEHWGLIPPDFWHGAFYQPLTSMFLHGGLLHLAFIVMTLWSIGPVMETTIGSLRFGLLYLFSGLFAALFIVVFQRGIGAWSVGASGALLGLLGALAAFYPKSELSLFFFPMKVRTAVLWVGVASVVLAIFDRSSGISHVGHLGGLLGGILYTKFVLQLSFLRNDLHQTPASRFQIRRPGSDQERMHRQAQALEEQLRQMMDQLQQERAASQPSSSSPDQPEPFNEIIREEGLQSGGEGKRVFFDPVTGRLYMK